MKSAEKINIIVTHSDKMSDRVKTSRRNFAAQMAKRLIEQARAERQAQRIL